MLLLLRLLCVITNVFQTNSKTISNEYSKVEQHSNKYLHQLMMSHSVFVDVRRFRVVADVLIGGSILIGGLFNLFIQFAQFQNPRVDFVLRQLRQMWTDGFTLFIGFTELLVCCILCAWSFVLRRRSNKLNARFFHFCEAVIMFCFSHHHLAIPFVSFVLTIHQMGMTFRLHRSRINGMHAPMCAYTLYCGHAH